MASLDRDGWSEWSRHALEVAENMGQYAAILDEDGLPLCDLPPLLNLQASRTRGEPASVVATVMVNAGKGIPHRCVAHIMAEGLGEVDSEGRMKPIVDKTRFLFIRRSNYRNRVYWITHCVAKGNNPFAPSMIEIHGVEVLKMLDLFPAMSGPISWKENPFFDFTRDWKGEPNKIIQFKRPRRLADIQMATSADGTTIKGEAREVIRTVIDSSLQACWRIAGINKSDAPIMLNKKQRWDTKKTPELLLRPQDGPLLETISAPALAAGIDISAWMWFPFKGYINEEVGTPMKPVILVDVTATRRKAQ